MFNIKLFMNLDLISSFLIKFIIHQNFQNFIVYHSFKYFIALIKIHIDNYKN